MNLSALQTFLAILETGSLVRASEKLNVTQSTITARLQALESHLGETLINRVKSGATPTAAGLRLRRYAETILGLWGQAQQEARLPASVGSICNLATDPDLWPGLGDRIMHHILDADPSSALSVLQGSDDQLAGWLDTGRADLVLTTAPPRQAGVTVYELRPDALILVSTEVDTPIRFNPGYVFVEAGEAFGRAHAVFYADAGTARITFGVAAPALDFLLSRGGSAYLPRRIVKTALAARRLHEIQTAPTFERPIYLAAKTQAAARWPWLPDLIAHLSDGAP